MNDHVIKKKCSFPMVRLSEIKEFFRQTDECHERLEQEIRDMRATLDGEDFWMKEKHRKVAK